jgi:hypothetical protein
MKSLLSVVAFLTIISSPSLAQDYKAGKWLLTVTAEMSSMPGMPKGNMTPNSHTREYCVTEADKEKNFVKADNCSFSDRKTNGNTVSWKMACGPEPKMNGDITLVFAGDSYTGNSTLVMEIPDMPKMTIKGKYVGKYLGSC